MIGALVMSGTFMVVIFLLVLILFVNIKRWAEKRDEAITKRYDELAGRLDETQSLLRKEVTTILKNINNLLNNKN